MIVEVVVNNGNDTIKFYDVNYKVRNRGEVLSIYSKINGKCICDFFEWTLATWTEEIDDEWVTCDIDTDMRRTLCPYCRTPWRPGLILDPVNDLEFCAGCGRPVHAGDWIVEDGE